MSNVIKRVELDMIGFDVGNDPVKQGQLALRWRKLIYDDDVLVATEYHRALIDVDTDLDATFDMVAQDLERQGFGRPPETDRGYIDDATNRAWTPEVRAAVAVDRKEKAEREAAAQADRARQEQEAANAKKAAEAEMFDRFKRMMEGGGE